MNKLKERLAQLLKDLESAETMDAAREIKGQIDETKEQLDLLEMKSHVLDAMKSNEPVAAKRTEARAKSLGEHFVKYREAHPDQENRIVATPWAKAAGDPTMSTGLVAVEYDREPVRRVAAPLDVLDLFGRKTISSPVYSWNQYVSTTGSVGVTAEGVTKNKLTYTYQPKTATLQKITGFIKVTEELFNDAVYMVDAINQDLVDDLEANRQAQAVATLLATSGIATDTVAANATDVDLFKAILEAAADIEDATHIPADAVAVTPEIWLRLRSSLDAENRFYAGSPFGDSKYDRLFEMTFVKSADVTANHIVVGAFRRGAELVSKADGIRVDSTNSNDVDFEKNLISIRAEAREILAVKRPGCFCDITVS